jgi:GNAT superfamily N-acetyltransferase
MRIEITPFRAEYVQPAAELLAARHRRDRRRYSALPAMLENPARARRFVQAAFDHADGVVGLIDDRPAGYLLGERLRVKPDDLDALYYDPRSVLTPSSGHAVADDLPHTAAVELYRRMYAVAAAEWVRAGFVAHYVKAPAGDDDVLEAWYSLGFGRHEALGLRDIDTGAPVTAPAGVVVRQAGPADLDAVQQLVTALSRYHAEAPMFYHYLPTTAPAQRRELVAALATPTDHFLLAWDGARPIGVMGIHGPIGSGIELMPPECPHLLFAWIEPEWRARGIGSLLLDHILAWAGARGHTRCTAGWSLANIPATAFWQRHGFEIVGLQLARVLSAEC